MKFNNVIDTLRLYCRELSARYGEEYQKQYGKSECFYRYLVVDEIEAQLCTLVDEELPDFGEFCGLVRGIPENYADPRLKNPSPEALEYIREAERAFLEGLEGVKPDCKAPQIPYFRYLTGEERNHVIARFREKWDYVPHKYWYPLTSLKIKEDTLFLMADYVEGYWPQIEILLGLTEKRIYSCGESDYSGLECAEVTEIVGYGGFETAYCPKDFSWIIYFSHEETVTFAGSILPEIRKILEPERAHWNRWECEW